MQKSNKPISYVVILRFYHETKEGSICFSFLLLKLVNLCNPISDFAIPSEMVFSTTNTKIRLQ